METSFAEHAITILREEVERAGGVREFARLHGVQASQISRWLSGATAPKLDDLGSIFDRIGVDVCRIRGCAGGRPVMFSLPEVVSSEDAETIGREEFVAVPIVRSLEALTRYEVPEENRSGWCIVDRHFESVAYRHDLVAMTVVNEDMSPTLHPGEMVLIDRDRPPIDQGRIYLVRAADGETGLGRVSTAAMPDGDLRILISNDNRNNIRPRIFSLRRDYGGDIYRCILGRAIWMRSRIVDA